MSDLEQAIAFAYKLRNWCTHSAKLFNLTRMYIDQSQPAANNWLEVIAKYADGQNLDKEGDTADGRRPITVEDAKMIIQAMDQYMADTEKIRDLIMRYALNPEQV